MVYINGPEQGPSYMYNNQYSANPIMGGQNIGIGPHQGNMGNLIAQNQFNPQQQQVPMFNGKPVDPRMFETPKIVMETDDKPHKPMFTISDSKPNSITVDISTDAEIKAKKRSKKKKEDDDTKLPATTEGPIIRADSTDTVTGEVVDSTLYTYNATTGLLHETLGQIDAINGALIQEFDTVKHSRTMKNKYNVLVGLSENIGSMISNRLNTIKEINNCITKSNDLDYKKYKDREAAQSAMNDDKYIADIYQAFMQNPQNQAPTYQMPAVDPAIMGSGIIRANVTQNDIDNPGAMIDTGYLSYLSNLSPEQNLMRYESDPDVKQVVVYDAASGAKFFQMMNTRTGEVIPNVPVYDDNIMMDTTLNLNTGIAKNLNLNESFPIIQINNTVTSQY